jgi:hypothetical protein
VVSAFCIRETASSALFSRTARSEFEQRTDQTRKTHGAEALFQHGNRVFSVAESGPRSRIDLTMNRYLAIHAIQGDYLRTQLPNAAANQQNLVRVSAGIVLRIR